MRIAAVFLATLLITTSLADVTDDASHSKLPSDGAFDGSIEAPDSLPQFVQAYQQRLSQTLEMMQSHIESYGGDVSKAMDNLNANPALKDRLKFAIFQKHKYAMGWGNRIRATQSTFYLALLTDRIFLAEHDMMQDNFDTPFIVNFNGKPMRFDWRYLGQTPAVQNASTAIQSFCADRIHTSIFRDDFKALEERNLTEKYASDRCVFYDQPYAFDQSLGLNRVHAARTEELFGTLSRFYRYKQLIGFLLRRPSKILLDEASRVQQALGMVNPSGPRPYRIGLQLRLFFDQPNHSKHLGEVGFFWDCARELVREIAASYRKNVTACIEALSKPPNAPPAAEEELTRCGSKDVVVYFSSDTESQREAAVQQLSSFVTVVYNNRPVVHTSAIPQNGVNTALLDWYMIGECDDVIISGTSYGYTAYGRRSPEVEKFHPQRLYLSPLQSWGAYRHCGQLPAPSYFHRGPETDIHFDF